jgi:hypothetical protein
VAATRNNLKLWQADLIAELSATHGEPSTICSPSTNRTTYIWSDEKKLMARFLPDENRLFVYGSSITETNYYPLTGKVQTELSRFKHGSTTKHWNSQGQSVTAKQHKEGEA